MMPNDDEPTRCLSEEEFLTVEKLVAAAFAFNFMSVPGGTGPGTLDATLLRAWSWRRRQTARLPTGMPSRKRPGRGEYLQAMAMYTDLRLEMRSVRRGWGLSSASRPPASCTPRRLVLGPM